MNNANIVSWNKATDYTNPSDLGLYIHIPFCAKKCDYCDFLSAPANEDTINRYFDALLIEIEQYYGKTGSYIVPTIFIGGGTPSFVDAGHIEHVMEAISRVFAIDTKRLEVTIEINPGTITEDKLLTYRRIGINRLSFGLQSTNNDELKLLGRIHTYEQFEDNYYLARKLGFKNINIDLMSALPGQTLSAWEETLNKVIALNPEHISAYSLMIEEGTIFYERYHENQVASKQLPDEETDRLIYHRTKEILKENGYQRYEISNYAKVGYECRHNNSYWIGTQYLGIGLGASSLVENIRFSNLHDIALYMRKCVTFSEYPACSNVDGDAIENKKGILADGIGLRSNLETLTDKDKMEEFMFLGLRICAGISKKDFFNRFGVDIGNIYGNEIKQLLKDKLLLMSDDCIKLTDYGLDISNYVLAMFVQD